MNVDIPRFPELSGATSSQHEISTGGSARAVKFAEPKRAPSGGTREKVERGGEVDDGYVAGQDRANEPLLRIGAAAVKQQPGSLGDHWCGRGEITTTSVHQRQAFAVASRPRVGDCKPDVGINQNR